MRKMELQEPKTAETPNFKVPNLERGLQILEYLVTCDSAVALNALARDLAIPGNSAARIMNALEYYGYVLRDPATKKYALTRKMLTMSHGSSDCKSLLEDSLDVMRELRDEVGETVVISILDQHQGLVLDQIPGLHSFRFVVDPGTRQAPHSSASTKAILAFLPEEQCRQLLSQIKYPRLTGSTITSRKAFEKELAAVRSCGYALDRGEAIDGVHCAAAPILDHRGRAEAAITVTGPSSRMSLKSLARTGRLIKTFADRVSRKRGFLP